MKRIGKPMLLIATACVELLASVGCGGLVRENVTLGLREASLSTATEIINGFFDQRFPTAADPAQNGGSNRDLFINP